MSTSYGATGLGQTAVSTRRVSSFFEEYRDAFQERRELLPSPAIHKAT